MIERTIVVGDVHGCAAEFEALLEELRPTRRDRIVLLGDLINRGPDSARVVELARDYAYCSLLGNHELRLLNYRRTGDPTHLKKSDYDTLKQLRGRDWAYLETMPLTCRVPGAATVLVHGGSCPANRGAASPRGSSRASRSSVPTASPTSAPIFPARRTGRICGRVRPS